MQARLPLRPARNLDALRLPAGENIAAEPRPVDERFRRGADGLKPLQAKRQRSGEILRQRLFVLVLLRQQQARFEIGEPGRHHQIIGGELEAQIARRLDESEILLGQSQNRNLGEIDLLAARQLQQKIERALKAIDIDKERRFACRSLLLEGEISLPDQTLALRF